MKITLCGSTRYMQAFGDWNIILTKAGHIVYTVAQSAHGVKVPTPEEKRRFDLVHLQKIDESQAILVLNVDGYIGESTQREIEWAKMKGKSIYYLNNRVNNEIVGVSAMTFYNLFTDRPLRFMEEAAKYDVEFVTAENLSNDRPLKEETLTTSVEVGELG